MMYDCGCPSDSDSFYQTQTRQFMRQELWSEAGGYVEAVLDDRHPVYIRFYPGQSSRLDLRIACAHARKIANGNTQALHYFVMARGHGHRYARFLKLWRCSSVSISTMTGTLNSKHHQLSRTEMLQNLLEMTFCCAFQSLPATVLTEYFGNGIYSNVGLSNLPPLFQGANVPAYVRAKYLEFHQESPDADIAAFTGVRKTQNIENSNAKSRAQSWLRGDYRQAVEQLLEDLNFEPASLTHVSGEADSTRIVSVNVQDEIEKLVLEAKICGSQEPRSFASPVGSPQARIGVVLCSESEIIENSGQGLQPLRGLKLTEENSVIWTSSFERMGSGPSRRRADSKHLDRIASLNRSVITGGGIKVVVMCGLKAQQDIIRAFTHQNLGSQLTGPHELLLRNYCYNVWFFTSGKDVTKMFIESPEPFLVDVLHNITQARRLKDVFGLTSALTDERIKFNVWENTCFHAALMAQVRREAGGAEPLTAASLGIVYRDWLHYRGFVDVADIEELERTAGNLTVALLQIRVILSHKARGFKSILDEGYLGYRGKFDETAYKKTAALFERVYQKHLSAIHTFQKARQNPRLDDGEVIDIQDAINDNDDITSEDAVQSLNNLIMVVDEGTGGNDLDPELPVDEEESHPDDDDEITQRHSPSTPTERPGLGMRPRLAAMLSETGLKIEAKAPNTARAVSRILGLTHGLIRFSVKPSKGIAFCPKPLFAVRVDLSKSGVPHPHRFLGNIKWYNSEDPCLRLGIQYRLLDNNDGRGASVNWEWASASASDVGRKELLERIYKANTFVELLENKTARDLVGISRRSLVSWYQARRPRQAQSSRIDRDTPGTP